jgi:peptide subunit release factor 1 (eRF1)
MGKIDTSEQEANSIEMWKIRKVIENLEKARG